MIKEVFDCDKLLQ